MKFEEAVVVRELIDRVREQTGAKRLIFCGSSKGGYTALNFGLDYPGSYMVVGGPQYFLGQSLLDTGNIEALKHIAGQVCKEKVEFLNEYLPKKVAANRYAPSQRIYLHYSDSEHTYGGTYPLSAPGSGEKGIPLQRGRGTLQGTRGDQSVFSGIFIT